jgi:hypothetical protein
LELGIGKGSFLLPGFASRGNRMSAALPRRRCYLKASLQTRLPFFLSNGHSLLN